MTVTNSKTIFTIGTLFVCTGNEHERVQVQWYHRTSTLVTGSHIMYLRMPVGVPGLSAFLMPSFL